MILLRCPATVLASGSPFINKNYGKVHTAKKNSKSRSAVRGFPELATGNNDAAPKGSEGIA